VGFRGVEETEAQQGGGDGGKEDVSVVSGAAVLAGALAGRVSRVLWSVARGGGTTSGRHVAAGASTPL
jgi:hypothetical protein